MTDNLTKDDCEFLINFVMRTADFCRAGNRVERMEAELEVRRLFREQSMRQGFTVGRLLKRIEREGAP